MSATDPRVAAWAWADSEPQSVAPGVHRLPLPLPQDGLRAVNVYVVDSPDGVTLIDGGWATAQSMHALEDGLGSLGRDLMDVRSVLVTHIHRDHYTQAVWLRRKVGARVHLGIGERPGLELLREVNSGVPVTALTELLRAGESELAERIRRRVQLADNFDPGMWEDPDGWLEAGPVALGGRTLQVIPTPGHTRGHVVFLDAANGLLFAGDHVLPHITPSIGFELGARGLPLADFLNSLRLLREYPDTRLLPAHGGVGDSVHHRIGELLAHHDVRLARSVEAVETLGVASAGEVAAVLTWTRRQRPYSSLDDFNRMLAVCETAAHLEVLVQRGQLDLQLDDGVARYRSLGQVGAVSDIGVDPALLIRTAEQEELHKIAAQFVDDVSGPPDVVRHAATATGFDPAIWRRIAGELGVAGIAVPAEYGGAGGSFGDLAVVLQEAGRRLLCAPLLASAVLGAWAVHASGDEDACRRLLPGIASGNTIATLAGTSGPPTTTLVEGSRDGASWRLDGAVDFVLHGAAAQLILLLAATDVGATLFAVAAGERGLTRTVRTVLDATRPQAQLSFSGVSATAVGEPGAGERAVAQALDVGRAALAAEQVGATEHALRECVAFVAQRRQFGRPIGSFQAVKHRLADLLVELEGARAIAAYAGACVDGGEQGARELPLAAAAAQVACGDALLLAAREYVQLHGGIGFTWEHPAHLYVRRARADAALFGTGGQNRERIAVLAGLGGDRSIRGGDDG